MANEEREALKAIRAVIAVAQSNFPADTNVTIQAPGKNNASVTLQASALAALLKEEE